MLAAEAVHRFFLLLPCGLTREEADPFRLGPVQTALCSTVTSPGFPSVCSFLPAGEDWGNLEVGLGQVVAMTLSLQVSMLALMLLPGSRGSGSWGSDLVQLHCCLRLTVSQADEVHLGS